MLNVSSWIWDHPGGAEAIVKVCVFCCLCVLGMERGKMIEEKVQNISLLFWSKKKMGVERKVEGDIVI